MQVLRAWSLHFYHQEWWIKLPLKALEWPRLKNGVIQTGVFIPADYLQQ